MDKSKNISYEVIRIVAMLMVIMVHVSSFIFWEPNITPRTFMYLNIIDSMSRIGVGLFIMLSGALLLDENRKSDRHTMMKRIKRILIVLFSWSLFYATYYKIYSPLKYSGTIVLKDFFELFIFGYYHMWYLYMLIGLYLVTPILRAFVKTENKDIVLWFIILAMFFEGVVPTFNQLFHIEILKRLSDSLMMNFVTGFVLYYVLGWYVTHIRINGKQRKILYLLGAAGLLFTITATYIITDPKTVVNETFYRNTGINIILYALGTFVFLNHTFRNIENKTAVKFITVLSSLSLGVYMIHAFIVEKVHVLHLSKRIVFLLPANFLLTAVISIAIVYIISKIPLLRKTI